MAGMQEVVALVHRQMEEVASLRQRIMSHLMNSNMRRKKRSRKLGETATKGRLLLS